MLQRAIIAIYLLVSPLAVAAQELSSGIAFRFGLGPSVAPGYFGDADLDPGVGAKFQLERIRIGSLSLAGDDTYGLGFGGSLRVVGARSAENYDELAGLAEVDASLEVGGGLELTAPDYEVFAKLRYGLLGHEAFVAELGSDILFRPTDQITFKVGPRILLGDDKYAQTYFGVSEAEALTSSFAAFDARGGIISAGARAEATYAINNDWDVVGTLQFEQFQEDAAESPVTQSDDQISGSIVLTRRISFGF